MSDINTFSPFVNPFNTAFLQTSLLPDTSASRTTPRSIAQDVADDNDITKAPFAKANEKERGLGQVIYVSDEGDTPNAFNQNVSTSIGSQVSKYASVIVILLLALITLNLYSKS